MLHKIADAVEVDHNAARLLWSGSDRALEEASGRCSILRSILVSNGECSEVLVRWVRGQFGHELECCFIARMYVLCEQSSSGEMVSTVPLPGVATPSPSHSHSDKMVPFPL